jgi:hypothetical protein
MVKSIMRWAWDGRQPNLRTVPKEGWPRKLKLSRQNWGGIVATIIVFTHPL